MSFSHCISIELPEGRERETEKERKRERTMSLKSNKIDNVCYFALLVFACVILSSSNHGQTNLEKEIRGLIANVTGLFNSVLMYFISPLCFFPILSNLISINLSYPVHQTYEYSIYYLIITCTFLVLEG